MKTKLFIGLLLTATIAKGQTLSSGDFNNLTFGNVATQPFVPGQDGWETYADDGDLAKFQILPIGNPGNCLQIIGTNSTNGESAAYKGIPWATRTAGNNILTGSVDLYTGNNFTSRSEVLFLVEANIPNVGYQAAGGFSYKTDTGVINGIARTNNNGTPATNLNIDLQAPPLQPNTWYKLTFTYSTINAQVAWRVTTGTAVIVNNFTLPLANFTQASPIANIVFNVRSQEGQNNSVSPTVRFDNYSISATNTSALSNEIKVANKMNVIIYPNPVNNILNITDLEGVTSLAINDINGRTIKAVNGTSSINVSDLNTGIYFVNIITEYGSVTKRFIKN